MTKLQWTNGRTDSYGGAYVYEMGGLWVLSTDRDETSEAGFVSFEAAEWHLVHKARENGWDR